MVTAKTARDAVGLIQEAEEILQHVKSLLESSSARVQEVDLGERILAEILQRGGSVSKQELYALAEKHGMDRRGLGGFFRQSGKTSLYELLGTDKVVLTPYGAEQARRFLERRPSMMYDEEPTTIYAKIAEKSFAEDWGSDEDSVYDSL